MRELKFRVFDKITNKMCDLVTISWKTWDIDTSTINYIVITSENGHTERQEHEVILMQYTGLKDKNSKEIYFGDILKHIYWLDEKSESFFTIKDEIINSCGCCSTIVGFEIEHDISVCEVVGNIHQNPELLDTK